MNTLPETILQFGAGRFLRASPISSFSRPRVGQHRSEKSSSSNRPATSARAVSTGKAASITSSFAATKMARSSTDRDLESISRAVVASSQWDEVTRTGALAVAPHHSVEYHGIRLQARSKDQPTDTRRVPFRRSCCWSCASALRRAPGLTIVPCELREHNADTLQGYCSNLPPTGVCRLVWQWLQTECVWLNTLVDRIVTGTPKEHPLLRKMRC